MSVPFDQQRTQSGNSIFEDVYVYGCLHVNEKCGIILTSPNGTKYFIRATDDGIVTGTVADNDPALIGTGTGNGAQGVQGVQGIQGPSDGDTGAQGTQGIQGIQGIQGPPDGADGANGNQGLQGVQGTQGVQGIQGSTGSQGDIGVQGTDGAQGIQGPSDGAQGVQGATGAQGIQGPADGAQGVQGRQGVQGTFGPGTIPQNAKTSNYTLQSSDIGKHIALNSSADVIIPSSVFLAGDVVSVYNNTSSDITIQGGGGVRMAGTSLTGNRTLAQRGIATILCTSLNQFVIFGQGLT